jgi:putative transposase
VIGVAALGVRFAPLCGVLPKRPRLATFDYLGRYRYFLTFCTAGRHDAFVSDEPVRLVRSEILIASSTCDFAIPAYVFMPDHLHLLVTGTTGTSDLQHFTKLAKQRSAFTYSQAKRRRLWQPGYYDHVLRPEESSLSFIHYMFQNPVRAGLGERWIDYPYLGSETMSLCEIERALDEAGAASWSP